MAELTPLALWRRFLAAPADSRGKTLAMAFLVSAAAALAVSTAAALLGPRLDANRAAEAQARLDALVAAIPGLAGILAETGAEELEALVIDLATGRPAEGIDPETFDPVAAAADPDNRTALPPEADIAGLGERADLQRLYLARQGGEIALAILPVEGTGYQSRIKGWLALGAGLDTVAGLTITEQGETPGLGARIEDPAWLALWPGTELAEDGELKVAVARGPARTEYEVDGIAGATRTGTGVTNMIRFWLGPEGFGPVLAALKAGEF